MSTIKIFIFCDIQLSLKYIHTGQIGNAYSILNINSTCAVIRIKYRLRGNCKRYISWWTGQVKLE
jgi:hypothetical protein